MNTVKWVSVPLSDVLANTSRLDAPAYNVEARQTRERVLHSPCGTVPLAGAGGLAEAWVRGRFKRIWVEHSDYPIYQPTSVLDVKPTPDAYISKLTKTNIDALRVHNGQVLLACSGTVGGAAFVSRTLDNCVLSHDMIRLDCHAYPGYVYAFLKTDTGRLLVQTNMSGAVIDHITPKQLADVPVPDAPDAARREIHGLICRSCALRDESNDLIDEADALLTRELQLPPVDDLRGPRVFAASPNVPGLRFDASYHVPVVDAIMARLRKSAAEVTTVDDGRISRAIVLPGRFKRAFVESNRGRVFLGGKQIGQLDPDGKKYLSLLRHGKRIAKELELRENMTLITCSGTIGRVALAPRHFDGWTASQHVIRVVPTSGSVAGYLYVWLASEWGRELLRRYTYGAVIGEINDAQVSAVAVPLLKDAAAQARINSLALAANAKRYEAYTLEREAVRRVAELCGE